MINPEQVQKSSVVAVDPFKFTSFIRRFLPLPLNDEVNSTGKAALSNHLQRAFKLFELSVCSTLCSVRVYVSWQRLVL